MAELIVMDTDIISAFAKIGRLNQLKKLFSHHQLVITPMIYEELAVSLEYGYSFPKDIFGQLNIVSPTDEEEHEYHRLLTSKRALGKGELEAICICTKRSGIFSSMDSAALKYAETNGVVTLTLHSILRSFWVSGLLSRTSVKSLIRDIEEKDHMEIADVDLIFEDL